MITAAVAFVLMGGPLRMRFPGGDAADLARSLSTHLSRPVAMYVYDGAKMDGFSFQYDTAKDFNRLLDVKVGWTLEGADAVGGSMGKWGRECYSRKYLGYVDALIKPWKFKSFERGQPISLSTPAAKYVTLESLTSLAWTKPVVVNGFYKQFKIALTCKDASEAQVLKSVAHAVGAKFVETKSSFKLSFDPAEYRSRFMKLLADPGEFDERMDASERRYIVGRERLMSAIISEVTDEQLMACFEGNQKNVIMDVSSGGLLHDAFGNAMSGWARYGQEQSASGTPSVDRTIEQMVDYNKPFRVMFQPPFACSMVFSAKNGGTILH